MIKILEDFFLFLFLILYFFVGTEFLRTKYNEMSIFVQNKSIFPCSREIAFIVAIGTRQKCKKQIEFHNLLMQKEAVMMI